MMLVYIEIDIGEYLNYEFSKMYIHIKSCAHLLVKCDIFITLKYNFNLATTLFINYLLDFENTSTFRSSKIFNK